MRVVMQMRKWSAIAPVVLGIAIYYCEWFEVIAPGFCDHGWGFTIGRMYGLPLIVAGFLGAYRYDQPIQAWLHLMLPSLAMRLYLLLGQPGGPGNLWPLLVGVDLLHFILTGVVVGVVARLKRRRIGDNKPDSDLNGM